MGESSAACTIVRNASVKASMRPSHFGCGPNESRQGSRTFARRGQKLRGSFRVLGSQFGPTCVHYGRFLCSSALQSACSMLPSVLGRAFLGQSCLGPGVGAGIPRAQAHKWQWRDIKGRVLVLGGVFCGRGMRGRKVRGNQSANCMGSSLDQRSPIGHISFMVVSYSDTTDSGCHR